VVEELLLLLAILDSEFGPYKPSTEPTLEPMAQAEPPTEAPSTFSPASRSRRAGASNRVFHLDELSLDTKSLGQMSA
jgi:hypothetical protein